MQLTWDLGMDHVRSWVLTSDYEFDSSFDRPFAWSSTVVTGLSEAAAAPQPVDASAHLDAGANVTPISDPSTTPSSILPPPSSSPAMEQFRGVADHLEDVLIPRHLDVRRVFHNARYTWQHLLDGALTLPRGSFPLGHDPVIALQDMPALPNSLPPNGVLAGAPTWNVPDPEASEMFPNEGLDLNHVTGTTKYYRLSHPDAANCHISSGPNAYHYGRPSSSNVGASGAPQGLAILTMCWSYIFSTRLLQLQGRRVHYTDACLRPFPTDAIDGPDQNEILVRVPGEASTALVHWLCAILSPKSGWSADNKGGPFTPWAATCTGETRFVVVTDEEVVFDEDAVPPNDVEATDLLIEFCNLFSIGADLTATEDSAQLCPIKAAFLATLAIPFYRLAKLQPNFPKPILEPKKTASVLTSQQASSIRRYTDDLQYYMTLSMHPLTLGPVIWGIFWQPSIQCNLASPWLSAIKDVITPALDDGDFELLAKLFFHRRPRASIWWHGLFLLGDPKLLDFIRNYLDTLDEGCFYDTLSRPDIVAAAWTGVSHSYQDDTTHRVYQELNDHVPRADLLQHRHTLTLRDPWPLFYGWRPFGSVLKETIEPDLYPWLERGHEREYQYWTWWAKDNSIKPAASTGFRIDTNRFDDSVPDFLDIIPAPEPNAPIPGTVILPVEPSKRATLQMIAHSLGNIVGERSISTAVMPGLSNSHPWLKDWTPA